ncbi:tight adherence protein B [Arcanobacterium wilhelmae]|uniref:Tight adherence protein B n=1 Tax=Arcanobacterium wilhelmae TaxID=1803177 RepID=A0ABT9NBK3_9ACTO|nr:hypothetical protein [Arcanobacterium wilhelmae]MDP9801088.1 tight adherence protein B [Arcanobacterium wilhelmae]WFN90444.1 hypothetical protein P8A24_00855 [Arcanobacterium wilhelmae]
MMWLVAGVAVMAVMYVSVRRFGAPVGERRGEHGTRRRRRRGVRRRRKELDMGMLITEVATRLRSGATIERAWAMALESAGMEGEGGHLVGLGGRLRRIWRKGQENPPKWTSPGSTGAVLDREGVPVVLRELWNAGRWQRRQRGITSIAAATLPATFAVCRMGSATGAPMAEILEACAAGITETGEAKSARDVALAGPITSAQMLAVLPFFGMFLAWMLGIRLGEFVATLMGKVTFGAGLVFEVAGIWLVWRMVRVAKEKEAVE